MITLQAIISLGIFFFITCILPIVLIVYSIKKSKKHDMDYPSLNLQTSEAVLLIESINNSQFILMIFSLIERIFTLLFHYFTIYFLANCKDIKKALFISITIHSVFNIIGIFFINYVNSYIGRIIFIY